MTNVRHTLWLSIALVAVSFAAVPTGEATTFADPVAVDISSPPDGTWDPMPDPDVALDSSGHPHIVYQDDHESDLKYAWWTGSQWEVRVLETTGKAGSYASIALDSQDDPHISYHQEDQGELKYTTRDGDGPWTAKVIDDSNAGVGAYNDIAIDGEDDPYISYYNDVLGDLKRAFWDGSQWKVHTLDSGGDVGTYTSIALDSQNNPHISYHDETNGDLKFTQWVPGSGWETETVDTSGGRFTSLALDDQGDPYISYFAGSQDLKYGYWDGSQWNPHTLDSQGDQGRGTSIALDSQGDPHIAYYDNTNNDVKYTWWDGSGWQKQTLASGEEPAIALDGSQRPHVAYRPHANKLSYLGPEALPANAAPDVDISYTPGNPTVEDIIEFTATVTDSDGEVTSYAWDFGDGTTTTLENPTHVYGGQGTYVVRLTVEDEDADGRVGSDTLQISVDASSPDTNKAPSVDFSYEPKAPMAGGTVSFRQDAVDPDGSIADWVWDFGDGATSSAPNPAHTYARAGTYTVELLVTDDEGARNADTQKIVVERSTGEIDAQFAYAHANGEPNTFEFQDHSTAGSDPITQWAWSFGDGATSGASNPVHTYEATGTYTVSLTITDTANRTDTATKTVTVDQVPVDNHPPQAVLDADPISVAAGEEVVLDASRSEDPYGKICKYTFHLDLDGDGQTEEVSGSPIFRHSFAASGPKPVTVTVEDCEGASDEATITLQVAKAEETSDSPGAGVLAVLVTLGVAAITVTARSSRGER